MKFHVGQPVWAIAINVPDRWLPGVVLELPGCNRPCPCGCGQWILALDYSVEILETGTWHCQIVASTERHLRPRDPDQHTPATLITDDITTDDITNERETVT